MRKKQVIAFLFAFSVFAAGCGNPLMDKPAPDFSARDIAGDVIKLSDLHGKVVLIDFWATWCPPCIEEAPNIKRIYEKNKAAMEKQQDIIYQWYDYEFNNLDNLIKEKTK